MTFHTGALAHDLRNEVRRATCAPAEGARPETDATARGWICVPLDSRRHPWREGTAKMDVVGLGALGLGGADALGWRRGALPGRGDLAPGPL